MASKELLEREIKTLPSDKVGEVLDFVRFVKVRKPFPAEITLASESSLSKDWLLPQEDVAWANL